MKKEASPVDTGWAWVICAAGCFLHIAVVGSIRSIGILLTSVSEHYNRSKRDTSWIMGLMFLAFLLLSPITMALARRFTARLVVLLGGIVLCLGFSLSYFVMSLELLYLTIGLLVGTGISMTHPPTVILINYYFDRHRTVAMGITMAGGSAGALCMPALMNWLIDRYTFRGCMLVWGGLMLNVAVAGALMRPFVESAQPAATEAAGDEASAKEPLVVEAQLEAAAASVDNGHCDSRCCKSAENLHCRELGCASLRRATSAAALQNKREDQQQHQQQHQHQHSVLHHLLELLDRPPPKLTMLASCGDIGLLVGQPASVAALEVPPRPPPDAEQHEGGGQKPLLTEAPQEAPSGGRRLVGAIRSALNLNPRLLRKPRVWFLLIGLAMAAQGLLFNLMILPQHGKNIGMSAPEYTRLMQYQGITDFLVRIGIGYFADHQLIRRQLLMVALLVGQGVLWCLLLHPTAAAALAFSLLEGALTGGVITNMAPILVDSFGVENLPTTYGFLGVLQSFVMISVPILLGDLFDKTGSWNASIVVVASLMVSSGLILLADDLLHQRSRRRKLVREPVSC